MRNESRKSTFPVKYLAYTPPKELEEGGLIEEWARESLATVIPVPKIYTIDVYSRKYPQYFRQIWKMETGKDITETKTWLSNGFRSLVVGLHLCGSMTIYGMDTGVSCKEEQYRDVKVSEHTSKK